MGQTWRRGQGPWDRDLTVRSPRSPCSAFSPAAELIDWLWSRLGSGVGVLTNCWFLSRRKQAESKESGSTEEWLSRQLTKLRPAFLCSSHHATEATEATSRITTPTTESLPTCTNSHCRCQPSTVLDCYASYSYPEQSCKCKKSYHLESLRVF